MARLRLLSLVSYVYVLCQAVNVRGLTNLLPDVGDRYRRQDAVFKNCLNAYNQTLDCTDDLNLARHYYQYEWTAEKLEGLCTPACSASIAKWAQDVEATCDNDELPFIFDYTSFKGSVFAEKLKYGYDMACMKSKDPGVDKWCQLETAKWHRYVLESYVTVEPTPQNQNSSIQRRQNMIFPDWDECMDACDSEDGDCADHDHAGGSSVNKRETPKEHEWGTSTSSQPRHGFQPLENSTAPAHQEDGPARLPSEETTGLLSAYPREVLCSSCFLDRLAIQANAYSSNWSPALANDYAEIGELCSKKLTPVARNDTQFVKTTFSPIAPTEIPRPTDLACPGGASKFYDTDTPLSLSNGYIVSTAELLYLNGLPLDEATLWAPFKKSAPKKSAFCVPLSCEILQVDKGDTCESIIETTNMTTTLFFSWNPHLIGDCTSGLVALQNICVGPPGGRYGLPDPIHTAIYSSIYGGNMTGLYLNTSRLSTSTNSRYGNYSATVMVDPSTTLVSPRTTIYPTYNISSVWNSTNQTFTNANSSLTSIHSRSPTPIIEN
ncbi:hypothetical protein DRE_04207 [Drechslerella stenobrocha 248]|uniref:LysM domain-containing protein n=1 Tax=Drechslerella stenobrocha 248 TaxID=1043628 RepID=W7HT53_9PEZI|nr:hypothetical protein DRE_04207 [Drechslerella stenobrocha 248]